ncbi:hypothetical protein [Nocardioides ultimimeridianus]
MRLRALVAALLCAPVLATCGAATPGQDAGDAAGAGAGSLTGTAAARQAEAERMADLLLSLATEDADPQGLVGWAGGWQECVVYSGHQVEFRASGSFDVEGSGDLQAVLERARASQWQVRGVRMRPGHLAFDLTGADFDDRPAGSYYDGLFGGLVLSDHFAELDVATGCVPVSGPEAERLVTAGSVSSDD